MILSRFDFKNYIINIRLSAQLSQRLGVLQRLKYFELNSKTTSPHLNFYLADTANKFTKPINPIPPTPTEITRASQLSLLKSACSFDADLLSYKGINLGSAINMKLAVKLGSLLGKQQG